MNVLKSFFTRSTEVDPDPSIDRSQENEDIKMPVSIGRMVDGNTMFNIKS